MRFGGIDLAEAIDMASRRPAQLIDLDRPGLEVGAIADLCVFDLPTAAGESLRIQATYHRGIKS